MWQKVHPSWFRIWQVKPRPSEWFAKSKKDNSMMFVEDIQIRKHIEETYKNLGVAKTVIRKTSLGGEIILFCSKPAALAGKDGKWIVNVEKKLSVKLKKDFKITLKEIKTPELSAKIMAEYMASQIEWRIPYKRVAKSIVEKTIEKWAEGIKIMIWGRLNGADMSRSDKYSKGRIPLQTIRADIDYHYTTATTKYGILGIKVRICKWDMYEKKIIIEQPL